MLFLRCSQGRILCILLYQFDIIFTTLQPFVPQRLFYPNNLTFSGFHSLQYFQLALCLVNSFDMAKVALSNTKILAPCYYILGGNSSGQV